MHHLIVSLALAAGLLLGGCGQLGPLYEPGTAPPKHNPPNDTADPGITP